MSHIKYALSFYSGEQHHRTRTQTKKRWGPALWLWKGLVALARAKFRKLQIKIRLHKEEQNYKSKHGTHKANASHKAANQKKPHAEKETVVHHNLHRKRKKCRASILHAALTENSRPPAGGYASVNRFARNGGRSQSNINPQNMGTHFSSCSAGFLFFSVSLMGSVFCGLSNQVTFRRLTAVDRYIIAVRRCYRSIRRMLLTVYTAYFGCLDFDILLFFCACGFFDLRLCAFCVVIDAFSSLYVSEFLIAACGVSPLRGRPALAKAQGLDPNAF